MNDNRLRSIWNDMKSRCYNPNVAIYKHYGGRGIGVCDLWRYNFYAFKGWANAHGYNDKLTIERIDVNGNYEPDNCRWATMVEQMRNRTNSIILTIDGETHDLAEWAEIKGMPYQTLYKRVTIYNWPEHRYFEPVKKCGRKRIT